MRKNLVDWQTLVAQFEKRVIEGHHIEVKQSILKLNLNDIPREFAGMIAELAWRISEPLISLKVLSKIMFPENEFAPGPSDKEKFIYATALGNLGGVDEAIKIFETINSQNEPEILLRKALASYRVWDYPFGIECLKEFLRQKGLAPYRLLIGKVNLAAGLIVDSKYESAQSLLLEIEAECLENKYLLLLGNSYELQAQIQFFLQQYESAEALLEKAMSLLQNQGGESVLFAEKWKMICRAFADRTENSIRDLKNFKVKAQNLRQWETVRECDLFISIINRDEDLARKVILGTPFEYYRGRVRRLFGKNILSKGHFQLSLGDPHTETNLIFNPYENQKSSKGLHSKPQLLALYEALSSDFYKPSHIGLLFQKIYKGEKFNAFTSPKRVLSLIKRLNQWFEDESVPLRINLKKSEFSLIAHENTPIKILVQRAQQLSKQDGNLYFLREAFRDRTFSAQVVSEKMNISRSSAQNLIADALKNGLVRKTGNGRSTNYALVPRNKKKVAA